MDDLPSCASELRKQKLFKKQKQDPSLAMDTPSGLPSTTAKPKSYAAALRAPRPPPGPTPLTMGALARLEVKQIEEEVRAANSWAGEDPAVRIKEWVFRIRASQNGKELIHPENQSRSK
ncbi:uncharacterized protein FSUBG_11724 [Fusarium subglutinans]|uniref:Uncharacterized protein n=1 Tax=Gibberella subglutinans TaxID=42677 RepID=A0A8H5L9B1_GIBSU|nr:uncharacterized protein FSUBG_11724 [Fusarium subglutinans]KAF5587697.1 hypothetical protein FSUBG_11724 [Fusarium subglutinans]